MLAALLLTAQTPAAPDPRRPAPTFDSVPPDLPALIWWRCEGRARIFYSALGHKAEAWADPVHLKMVGGAIGWAARKEGAGCD